ncbi:MAG: ABC transporter permease [Anaerolineae bacterium]|jgi:ABC-type nitrate/sulfonate/bicarbonate transport system permease component
MERMTERASSKSQRRGRELLAAYGPAASLVLALVVLWQLAVQIWQIQPWLLPSPLAILVAGWDARGLLADHVLQTGLETLLGFGLALAVGVGLALALDASAWIRKALYPLLVVSQTVPVVAIAPLLIIWFGYGIWPKVLVVGLVCFFPIVVSTLDGLRSADPDLIALVRTMGASPGQVFAKVRWPGALPGLFSGIKIGITYSVVGAIIGEWVGASRGLGVFMIRATNAFRTDWVFASILVVALLSLALFAIVQATERVVLRWYYAVRPERWEELG